MTAAVATGDRPLHLGYSLSTEEHGPLELVEYARRAERAGFTYASISDHFHPWIAAQGNSPFVWSVLGGIAAATDALAVGTGVTCPLIRYHPAIVAQAAATVARMLPGRFFLGVGTGEALNEHVTGERWPPTDVRLEMLEEAIGIIRALWTGDMVDHHGRHFTVENARLFTRPEAPPPIVVAASGPESARLAGSAGDGLINFSADASVVEAFEGAGGPSGAARPRYLQVNVCWDEDEAEARRIATRLCPTVALKGPLNVELPTPTHFEEAIAMVDEAAVAEVITCGPDPDRHIAAIRAGVEAGYDHLHVYQVGSNQEGFFRFYEEEILPRLARELTLATAG